MKLLHFAALALAWPVTTNAKPLDVTVMSTSAASLHANIALFTGENGAVLVDVPFTRADAYRLVADILDSGKTLEAIIITHDHPDHFFGLDVLQDAFPQAKVIAHPVVVKDITRSLPIKFKRWNPLLGANAPKRGVIPSEGPGYTLEGHKLEILGPMQGDHVHATAVWDPEARTLVAGDLVYNGMYVWLGEHQKPQYDAWLKALDALAALKPVRVVAGHTKPGLTDDSYAIDWTRRYIIAFKAMAKNSKTSQDLTAAVKAAYPDAIDVVGDFLLGNSSQVATGEMAPWDE